jgi:hypothetical protein
MLKDPRPHSRYTKTWSGSKIKFKKTTNDGISESFKDKFGVDTSKEGLKAMTTKGNSLVAKL